MSKARLELRVFGLMLITLLHQTGSHGHIQLVVNPTEHNGIFFSINVHELHCKMIMFPPDQFISRTLEVDIRHIDMDKYEAFLIQSTIHLTAQDNFHTIRRNKLASFNEVNSSNTWQRICSKDGQTVQKHRQIDSEHHRFFLHKKFLENSSL